MIMIDLVTHCRASIHDRKCLLTYRSEKKLKSHIAKITMSEYLNGPGKMNSPAPQVTARRLGMYRCPCFCLCSKRFVWN